MDSREAGTQEAGEAGGRRAGRNAEFCRGPGAPYEEACLGNGRIPAGQRGRTSRCPRCVVERRKRHMPRRADRPRRPPRRPAAADGRPATFTEALREADAVLASRRAEERARNPHVRWRTVRTETNDGTPVAWESIDLRHAINDR